MKTSMIAFALAATFWGPTATAAEGGKCHFHGEKPAAPSTVVGCAQQRKAALVTSEKIAASWKNLNPDKVEQVQGKKGREWKVSFKDPAAQDKAKQTLYMFFTLPGNFIAANFTGE